MACKWLELITCCNFGLFTAGFELRFLSNRTNESIKKRKKNLASKNKSNGLKVTQGVFLMHITSNIIFI